jgi:hypothetical protein
MNDMTADLARSNSLADLRERLKIEHAAMAAALTNSVEHAMAAGDILIEAKRQVGHGQWLPWLESCGISQRTAQRYMRVARHRPAIEANPTSVSDLGVSGALALLAVPRRPTPEDEAITNLFASLVEASGDAMFNFIQLEESEATAAVDEKRRALLVEARAAIDKIGELAAIAPELAGIIDSDPEGFCQRFIEQSGQYRAAVIAATGLTESEFEAFGARVHDLQAQGLDKRSVAIALAFSGEFDLDGVEPRPFDGTAIASSVRDTANDWLRWVEQRAAPADDLDVPEFLRRTKPASEAAE